MDKNIKDLKLKTNLALPKELSEIYANVDGLSLQNLFFSTYGVFPHCFMFTQSNRGGENYFQTEKIIEYLIENTPEDEEMEHVLYNTHDLTTGDERLGFCVTLKKSGIFARIEDCVSESYILYKTDSKDALYNFVDIMVKFYKAPEVEKNNLWTIGTTQTGFTLIKRKAREVKDFSVNEQYNDNFLPEYEKIENFINEEEKGGLVILHGEKGTGKTTFIRHLINKFDNRKFVFVPSNLIYLLGEPSFGTFLQTLANHVIILEDCENAIRDRKSGMGSSSAVSLLLNMTDGLLEDDLGLKFICTFNDDVKNIDSALLRKGRLVSKYEFKPLCVEKSNELLKKVFGVEGENAYKTTTPLTLADIYNFDEDSYESKRSSLI